MSGGFCWMLGCPVPQGLQTVGIILLLCFSLKLLCALGVINLASGVGWGQAQGICGEGAPHLLSQRLQSAWERFGRITLFWGIRWGWGGWSGEKRAFWYGRMSH